MMCTRELYSKRIRTSLKVLATGAIRLRITEHRLHTTRIDILYLVRTKSTLSVQTSTSHAC